MPTFGIEPLDGKSATADVFFVLILSLSFDFSDRVLADFVPEQQLQHRRRHSELNLWMVNWRLPMSFSF
jgi:hypothetical protein